ncbi:MAG: trigger factor [Bacilli bacterium]|nr:trigger factor [Bacilli bacterium]
MERKINKLEHSHVEVICTVDKENWKKAQEKAFKKLASKVEIKGFRKGKAPENLVKERVNHAEVLSNAVDSLLPEIYTAIIEEDKVRPYAQPKVDITKISDDELEVKFIIVTEPSVELGAYKGNKIGKEEAKVSDEQVEDACKELLEKNATLVVKEDAAKDGDTVVMDFVGTVDGKPFEGGSAENYELVLGSKSFIPGFEDQLVGHKAGEHVDVNVTFPEQYTEELKGKAAVFGCDIHEVKEKKLPELNNEFVIEQNIPGVETVEQLKAHLKDQKLKEEARKLKGQYFDKLLEVIAKASKIDIPEEVLAQQVEARKKDFMDRMAQSGLSFEQYLQILGQKEEDFLAQLKETASKELNNYLVLEEVAKKEGFNELKDEELEFEYARLADQYKMQVEDVKKALANQLGEFKNNIIMSRVENFLYENND